MDKAKVDKLLKIRNDMGDLLAHLQPNVSAEWDCLEKLTSAHKTLRGIDATELLQLTMPMDTK